MASEKKIVGFPKRSPNWSESEREVLVSNVIANYSKLFGRFSNKVTNQSKEILWSKITDMVNSQNNDTNRSVPNCKKQWTDLKSLAKKKAAKIYNSIKKTGVREIEKVVLDDVLEKIYCENWVLKIVRIIGEEVIYGIDEGIDSSAPRKLSTNDMQLPKTTDADSKVKVDNLEDENSRYTLPSSTMKLVHVPDFNELQKIYDSMVDFIIKPKKRLMKSNLDNQDKNVPLKKRVKHERLFKGHSGAPVAEKMFSVQENVLNELKMLNTHFEKLTNIAERILTNV